VTYLARAEPLGPAFDLAAAYRPFEATSGAFLFERGGLGLAGDCGVMTGPRGFAEVAAGIQRQGTGPAPVFAGVFPFDGGTDPVLRLLHPCVLRHRAGETWRVEVRPKEQADLFFELAPVEEVEGREAPKPPREAFHESRLRAEPAPEVYAEAVERATGRIRAGELRKVVLARSMVVDAGRELDPRRLVRRLRAVDPGCFTFAAPTDRGILVGATPEMLISRRGLEVRSNPLAGSAPRYGDAGEDRASGERLLGSVKDREEHALVVEAVGAALRPLCEELLGDDQPGLLATANVWHLSTRFRGRLREPAPSVLELVAALHPTPAVCGTPREAALKAIGELEPFDRGSYAGPVGWVDADGDGDWALALRCAEISGTQARLFAGAGIVTGSDPEMELDETERKFRALLDSLRWG